MKKIGIVIFWWKKGEGEPKNYCIYKYNPIYDNLIKTICDFCGKKPSDCCQVSDSSIILKSSYVDVKSTVGDMSNYAVTDYDLDSFFEDIEPNIDIVKEYNLDELLSDEDLKSYTISNIEKAKLKNWKLCRQNIYDEIKTLIEKLDENDTQCLDQIQDMISTKINKIKLNTITKKLIQKIDDIIKIEKINNENVKNYLSNLSVIKIDLEQADYFVSNSMKIKFKDFFISLCIHGDCETPNYSLDVISGCKKVNTTLHDEVYTDEVSFDNEDIEEIVSLIIKNKSILTKDKKTMKKILIIFFQYLVLSMDELLR